jgi:hypothetical protein
MERSVPVYECRRALAGSISIDGRLDDPGWQGIEPIGPFILSDGSGPASRRTEARMCWDDRCLYIAFRSDDPDIWGTHFSRDEPIYQEEVVEAFIDPDSDLVRYFEFQMSPHGTLFDALIDNPTGLRKDVVADTSWDCEGWLTGLQVEGTLDNRDDVDKGWTVEWAIPFASLTSAPNIPPKDDDTWRMNLYRIDRTPTPEFSCWSPTLRVPADFHVPMLFGTIIFRE